MRNVKKVTGILLAAVLTAVMGTLAFGNTKESYEPDYASVPFDGTVVSVENGSLMMSRRFDWGTDEMIINLTEETKILDAVNGYPISAENLKTGDAVRVYAGLTMTMSLPPMTNGVAVLCDVPADAGFPVYTDVEKLTKDSDGNYILSTIDGTKAAITKETRILPYLTRNIVRTDDLTPGTTILLWTDETSHSIATKIVVFEKDEYQEEPKVVREWKLTDAGWYFYMNGSVHKGWLLDGGDWYYLDPETGIMKTGFLTLNGKTYFLKEDGRMLKESHTFTVDENGELHF